MDDDSFPAAPEPPAPTQETTIAPPAPPTTPYTAWWQATPPPGVPVAPRTAPAPRPTSPSRPIVIAAIVGALVGALVSGGLVLAFRDDNGSSSQSQGTPAIPAANTATLPPLQLGGKQSGASVRAILARVRPAVVRINITTSQGSGGGTGFIVTSDGAIVTNAHVASGADTIEVTLSTGDRVRARVLGIDAAQDLAVIKIDRTGLPTVKLGDSDALQVGDSVIAIGNALDLEGELSVTAGIVSATDRNVDEQNGNSLVGLIQTDAAINPGNSGGPLVNSRGEVVGINTAIANPSDSNNVGFAIAITSARPIIEDLRAGRTATVAFLGVDGRDVTPSLVASQHLKVRAGSYVSALVPNSPAVKLGIRKGDVVIKLDGIDVGSSAALRRAIRRHHSGDKVDVTVDRNGSRLTFHAVLGSLPNQGN